MISDWMMPEMDGPTFCRAVRARALRNYVYIVLVTAMGEAERVVAGLEAGADDFMFKPFDTAVLLARLSTADCIIDLERSLLDRNREIEKLAVTDALTGHYNRRYVVDRLEEERRRCTRYGHFLSLIMGDVDHFKTVNDRHGHQAGDALLCAIAEALVRGTRHGVDWVARYGGEEFVVVMPETQSVGAMIAAERLRRMVAGLLIDFAGNRIAGTISLGVASLDPDSAAKETSMRELLQLADTRQYEAKHRGRNQTVSE